MDWRKFHETNGYALLHRRLMHCPKYSHCPKRNILESIPFTKGMEKLLSNRYDEHYKCPSCMIGQSTCQGVPGPAKKADRPLGKVNVLIGVCFLIGDPVCLCPHGNSKPWRRHGQASLPPGVPSQVQVQVLVHPDSTACRLACPTPSTLAWHSSELQIAQFC